MNPEFERKLEAEIDRALKSLPELPAPLTLAPRVRQMLEQRIRVPWHRRPWQSWPVTPRVASLAVLLAMFAGLCLGGWQLQRVHGYDLLGQEFAGFTAGLGRVWNVLDAIAGAFRLIVKGLSTPFLLACLGAFGFAWAACLGLGTLCVRLAFARR